MNIVITHETCVMFIGQKINVEIIFNKLYK